MPALDLQPSTPTPKFRVAICGGGPAGLALASIIAKYSDPAAPVAVDLYESQEKIGTVGAGISVWPRTRALLQKIGLMDKFKGELGADDKGPRTPKGFTFRVSDTDGPGYECYSMPMSSNPMLLHRSTVITTLQDSLPLPPLCTIHTSSRLTSYSYAASDKVGGPVTLHFVDGTTREADAILGADGVRSAVRDSMFPGGVYFDDTGLSHVVEPTWTGVIAYRCLITRSMLERVQEGNHQALTTPLLYLGKGKHIVTYPISRGELINLVGFVTTPGGYGTTYKGKWVRDASPEEMRACFAGWEPEVQAVLSSIESVSAWAIHVMVDVPRCAIGRAAILGDALHAMETHFGAGAGQAMEDAYVLGRILTHPATNKSSLTAALAAYEKSRLEFATSVVVKAHRVGLMYEFAQGELPSDDRKPDPAWGQRWGRVVQDEWSFQWASDDALDKFWATAEAELMRSSPYYG